MYAVWVKSRSQDFPVHPSSCRPCIASERTTLYGLVLQVHCISMHSQKTMYGECSALYTTALQFDSGDPPANDSTAKGAIRLKGQQEIHQSGLQAQTLPAVVRESQKRLTLLEWILENEA